MSATLMFLNGRAIPWGNGIVILALLCMTFFLLFLKIAQVKLGVLAIIPPMVIQCIL